MSSKEPVKPVYIPISMYEQIQERVDVSEFTSVEEYVLFVLEEVLKDDEEVEIVFSKEEEEEVKKRLKALGYLD